MYISNCMIGRLFHIIVTQNLLNINLIEHNFVEYNTDRQIIHYIITITSYLNLIKTGIVS